MGKIAWQLATEYESPQAKILKAKYFLDSIFLEIENPKLGLALWNGLQNTKFFLNKNKIQIIGDSRKVNFQKDKWLLPKPLKDHVTLSRLS